MTSDPEPSPSATPASGLSEQAARLIDLAEKHPKTTAAIIAGLSGSVGAVTGAAVEKHVLRNGPRPAVAPPTNMWGCLAANGHLAAWIIVFVFAFSAFSKCAGWS